MIVQAILLGLIAFIGKCDLATGTNMIQRPIVLGPLVGLVLGDLSAGITIGATLELFFLGSISVGRVHSPERHCGRRAGYRLRHQHRTGH